VTIRRFAAEAPVPRRLMFASCPRLMLRLLPFCGAGSRRIPRLRAGGASSCPSRAASRPRSGDLARAEVVALVELFHLVEDDAGGRCGYDSWAIWLPPSVSRWSLPSNQLFSTACLYRNVPG
jgi:hypothetical protein